MRRERLDRWVREHPVAVDGLLALALLGIALLNTGSGPGRLVGLLSAATVLPLACRRGRPVGSTVVVFTAALLLWFWTGSSQSAHLAVFVALYSVAAYGRRPAALTALIAVLTACVLEAVRLELQNNSLGIEGIRFSWSGLVQTVLVSWAFSVAIWVAGTLRGTRRAYLDALVDRARRIEVEREQQDRLAAAAERARIARELHDIVAHSLSVIILQADGGRMSARQDPAHAAGALDVVGDTARQALTDMRRLLGVLREDGTAERAPQPGLESLPGLVHGVRETGLQVDVEEQGERRSISPGMAMAAYRIVQESLTNVMKHAGPGAAATVRIDWQNTGLAIAVADDGRGAGTVGGGGDGRGRGLHGMRERAELYGGTVQAGPKVGGGYAVVARLPYPGARG